uniref:Uncharacterized protein n=1 Tax=Arundo donax TaxID=35708 RepID=A0A0A9DRE8_ARUDO
MRDCFNRWQLANSAIASPSTQMMWSCSSARRQPRWMSPMAS